MNLNESNNFFSCAATTWMTRRPSIPSMPKTRIWVRIFLMLWIISPILKTELLIVILNSCDRNFAIRATNTAQRFRKRTWHQLRYGQTRWSCDTPRSQCSSGKREGSCLAYPTKDIAARVFSYQYEYSQYRGKLRVRNLLLRNFSCEFRAFFEFFPSFVARNSLLEKKKHSKKRERDYKTRRGRNFHTSDSVPIWICILSRHENFTTDNHWDRLQGISIETQESSIHWFILTGFFICFKVNAMDALERSCTVTACNKNYNVILKVNFPGNYPQSAQPTFQFCPGTTVDNATMAKLLKVLKQTAQQRVRKNRTCLEPCLRQLISTLEQVTHSFFSFSDGKVFWHGFFDRNRRVSAFAEKTAEISWIFSILLWRTV